MKQSLITKTFKKTKNENRPALLTYTVAGDNTKKNSLRILKSISRYADICELGFPHNTPIADGGQIQTSAYRAIKNGIKMNDVFSIVSQFKKFKKDKPIILMGYYNMIYQYNEDKFINKCQKSKIDGLIVVDLPYPENKPFSKKCKKNNINFIQLVSPTTSRERLKLIIKDSHDMVYYISMLSTTGGKLKVSPKKILKEYSKIKKQNGSKNVVVGFGTYQYNEIVSGNISGVTARVKSWIVLTKTLEVSNLSGTFLPGEILVGQTSGASYSLRRKSTSTVDNPATNPNNRFGQNDTIQDEADDILDFSEINPFGTPWLVK